MDGSGEVRLPQRHVTELGSFFAAHDRWLFGHVRSKSSPLKVMRKGYSIIFANAARRSEAYRGRPRECMPSMPPRGTCPASSCLSCRRWTLCRCRRRRL